MCNERPSKGLERKASKKNLKCILCFFWKTPQGRLEVIHDLQKTLTGNICSTEAS